MPRQRGRLIIGAISAFWLVMMGLLVYNEVLLPRWHHQVRPAIAAHPQDLWMGLFVGEGERIGYLNLRTAPEERQGRAGMAVNISLRMTLSLFGRQTELAVKGQAFQPNIGGISSFDFVVNSGENEMRLREEVVEDKLKGEIETAGETLPLDLPVQHNLVLGGTTGLGAASVPLLEPGEVVFVDSFDPTSMRVGRARLEGQGVEDLEVMGERMKTYVVGAEIGGITSRAWVTAEGEVVRAETPFGFELRRIAPQEALAPVVASGNSSLIEALAVKVSGKTPQRGAAELRVRFSGVSPDDLPMTSEWQEREGDIYTIRRAEDPAKAPIQPLPKAEWTAALASDPFITANHPRIQALAGQITEGIQDPWEKAQRIYGWTYDNLEKIAVISVPNALEVLRTRQGDCNEHTILFAALARAAGIPTKVAIGLVWSDEINGFGYHAWPEVYVGQWTPMDPTLGQPIADATHIKLLEGSIERWTQLVPHIGKLAIEVL